MGEEMQTMVRTEVTIDGTSHFLSQGHDLEALKQRIIEALHAGGRFVSFTVVGNRAVDALISPGTRVVFSVETVQYDPRDTGDEATPYGGLYDL
ncbi:hypothetical protein [Microbacterium sp. NPDC096154]|uniref:hypothetical protein n=1 Tax=Microbacterium sp. NPDC096154 TaxID=3155549 RepID=UPI00332235DD